MFWCCAISGEEDDPSATQTCTGPAKANRARTLVYFNQLCVSAAWCWLSRWYHDFPMSGSDFCFATLPWPSAQKPHWGESRELSRERSGSLSTLLGRKGLEKDRARKQQGTGSLHSWRWVCVVWAWQRLTCWTKQLPQLVSLSWAWLLSYTLILLIYNDIFGMIYTWNPSMILVCWKKSLFWRVDLASFIQNMYIF